ncbi:hypothetical protein DY000_02023250 [Brassica cretica]|uniref:IBB domain-containing protein n=1 Tax=Brassica cretica TaxID=69181 RepID=A0ABQ7ELV9_BRACR|nr:hypothetical protein DY000_02023250 [Brassica cretica]
MVASPPLQRTLGIVTVEQNRVSAKARTGSEKQVYQLRLIEEEKSKRKKRKEREIHLRHHRKGRPELGFQVTLRLFITLKITLCYQAGTEREDALVALVRIRESEDGEESGVSDLEDPRRRCSSTVNVTLTPSQSPSQPQMNQAM